MNRRVILTTAVSGRQRIRLWWMFFNTHGKSIPPQRSFRTKRTAGQRQYRPDGQTVQGNPCPFAARDHLTGWVMWTVFVFLFVCVCLREENGFAFQRDLCVRWSFLGGVLRKERCGYLGGAKSHQSILTYPDS